MSINKKQYIAEIKADIELNESRLNSIYSTPLSEGGMDFLRDNIGNIIFSEDEIAADLDELDDLDEDDEFTLF
ncbi:MAG: hypothetical protein NC453_19120 [Muribaculum sp.]|nr:hypothetical protein [Muribaculum sp.]